VKTCAFFGHRECFGLDESRLEAAIEHAIVEYGCSVFWCGGMGAFDWLAARKVRKLKARYPHIRCVRVYAYLPVGKDPNEERCDESFVPDGLETALRRAAIPGAMHGWPGAATWPSFFSMFPRAAHMWRQ